jgi:eukaryotic-like serine/threonine-protein kinase
MSAMCSARQAQPSAATRSVRCSGRAGWGEVYLAHDRKLVRDVAVKTLPAEFAGDLERLARFQREARMLAALNHPNIAAIYGLEESEGDSFLVLELVEGETLAEWLQRKGPLPWSEALSVASQMAEGLEAAHAKGITHRDIKPPISRSHPKDG